MSVEDFIAFQTWGNRRLVAVRSAVCKHVCHMMVVMVAVRMGMYLARGEARHHHRHKQ